MYQKNTQGWVKHLDFIVLDLVSMQLAFMLAYIFRHGWMWPYGNREYAVFAMLIALVDTVVLILNETMKNVMRRGYYREFAQTLKHTVIVMLCVLFVLFALKETDTYSRIFLVCFIGIYVVLAYTVRIFWKRHMDKSARANRSAVYFISTTGRIEDLIQRYQAERPVRFLLKGICLLDADQTGTEVQGVPVDSTKETVLEYLCRQWVDEIVISIPEEYPYPSDLVRTLAEMGIVIHAEMEQVTKLDQQKKEIEQIAGRVVLSFGMNMATPAEAIAKRAMDILGGLVGCAITLVLTLILGPLIYIQSPGPIFFAQTRVGKNGKKFKMYKFRSMYMDAEARKEALMAQNRIGGGLMFKLDYDPRIIGSEKRPDGTIKKGIGNFIRDWSLDEFPQFFNVLKGDLSLVGTRPPTVDEWDRYELHHRARLAIKPGITGMWQVSGRSNITDFEEVVALDKKYIREWSLGLDFRILLQTIGVVLKKDGSM